MKIFKTTDGSAAQLESSDEDDTASEPEGFDSDDEEEYNRVPFEDAEDSQQPGPSAMSSKQPPSPSVPAQALASPQPTESNARASPQPTKPQAPAPPSTKQPAPLSWKTDKDPDTAPPVSRFQPLRTPGVQLCSNTTYTPLNLFKLFFPVKTVQTLCKNTNKQAAKKIANGKKYKWTDVDVEDFYKYIGLLLYMAMVKFDHIADYWRQNHFFSLPLPSQIMPRDRYRTISWNLHLSDPDEDVHNDNKKGTPEHDRLFRVKPLMDQINNACKSFYHPHKHLAVDERMVASKAKNMMSQYVKAKPTKWGFKLFVLADSKNGYTVDFSIYTGKRDFPSGHGLPYDVVMSLVRPSYLGTGYHIYTDNFYTSTKLFKALHDRKIAACGTYRLNLKDGPRTDLNALTKKSERGSIRWIREGPIVYVKWMDAREVSICSTIHPAHSGETVQRRMRERGGSWTKKTIPCPTPVAKYNENMGGVDLSDQLIQYYSAQHKTMRWYRNLFFHFVDIATTNCYIIHKEHCQAQKTKPMTHKTFMEELIADLCGKPLRISSARAPAGHLPVPIADVHVACHSAKATTGRKKCEHCQSQGQRKDTPWKCRECDVALCLQVDRNCFAAWHDG